MKIMSEKTGEYYDSVEECLEAEKEFEKEQRAKEERENRMKVERGNRAAELRDAYADYMECYERYVNLLSEYAKDYHSYNIDYPNKSYTSFDNLKINPLEILFDLL